VNASAAEVLDPLPTAADLPQPSFLQPRNTSIIEVLRRPLEFAQCC
jgi:hypothetical protein